jgi:hypothetical protein
MAFHRPKLAVALLKANVLNPENGLWRLVVTIGTSHPTAPRVLPWRCSRARGPPIVNGERTLLSAWLKQGRNWLALQERADLVWQIFFPKFENNFEAAFSRVEVCDVFALRSLLGRSLTLTHEKPCSKLFSDFGKKIY